MMPDPIVKFCFLTVYSSMSGDIVIFLGDWRLPESEAVAATPASAELPLT